MKAYCINLKKSTDRKALVTTEFEKAGLDVEFVDGYDAREENPLLENPIFIGDFGNLMSLRRVFENIVKNEHKMALVFEDTIRLVPNFSLKLESIKLPSKLDIIYLGYLLPVKYADHSDSLVRGKALGTWAFMVSLEAVKKILAFDPEDHWITLDVHLSALPLKTFYIKEKLAVRDKSVKTIGGASFLARNSIRAMTVSHVLQSFPTLEILFISLVLLLYVRLRR